MKNTIQSKWLITMVLAGSLAMAGFAQQKSSVGNAKQIESGPVQSSANPAQGALSPKGLQRITKEVRHELVMLPYYSVFDNLAYKVNPDGGVTLYGQVVNATLKSDAQNVVKKIEGVPRVDNQIQILPPSPFDDRIRRATLWAIYGENSPLFRYGWSSVAPIHIIVNGGHVTLEGVVDNQSDKNLAEIRAKQVPSVFSVTNNLVVANDGKS